MNLKHLRPVALSAALLVTAATVPAQSTRPSREPAQAAQPFAGGPLAGLGLPREGVAKQFSSMDKRGGNGDRIPIAPGETATIADFTGAGVVQRWWCTISPRSVRDIHSRLVLRIYWDGNDYPSVECPVGDFFGVGFGEQRDYISLPLNQTSGGYNCYWPMPFQKGMRWTVTNESDTPVRSFYYNITLTSYPDGLPRPMNYFHAQWRQERPVTAGKSYTVLQTQSTGYLADVAQWSGERQLFWNGVTEPGETLDLTFNAEAAGRYRIVGHFTRAGDYAKVRVLVNGQPVGEPINLYDNEVGKLPPTTFPAVDLKRGQNTLTLEIVGKDEKSDGYLVGLDAIEIDPA